MKKETAPQEEKEKKSVPLIGWISLALIAGLVAGYIFGYQAGEKPNNYFAPATCSKAFNEIGAQLQKSNNSLAAAILDQQAPADSYSEIRNNVKKCTGELVIQAPATTKPVTAVKK